MVLRGPALDRRHVVVVGVGVDIVETHRFERELGRGDWEPNDGIFTATEISYCSAGKDPAQCFAELFAAKEATLKALGITPTDLASFREAELRVKGFRQYELTLHGRLKMESENLRVRAFSLSISHVEQQTIATVILES
jgi:holo-[acyl-carrier protein] synthase